MVVKMNPNNMKVPKMPDGIEASTLLKFGVVIGIGLYAAGNKFYKVEGRHCAIVFSRIFGIKDIGFFLHNSLSLLLYAFIFLTKFFLVLVCVSFSH